MEWKDTTANVLSQHPEINTVWLDETFRVASFHEVSGYKKHSYTNRSYFMAFLHSLQLQGYRFQ